MRGTSVALLAILAGCDTVLRLDDIMPPPDAAPSGCPGNYVQLSTGFYRVETTPQAWSAAEAQCVADGVGLGGNYTHLAVMTTPELDTVFAYTQTVVTTKLWIGLTDQATPPPQCGGAPGNFYEWVTGDNVPVPAANTPPWYPGDPFDPCGQQCVELLPNVPNIDDNSCGDLYAFLCECDDHAEDPTHL